MRTWRSLRFSQPILTLATGACLAFALVALTLAAASSRATAEAAPVILVANPQETTISGTVVGTGDGLIGVHETGSEAAVAFPVAADATMSRDGVPVALADLRQRDTVTLTVDRATGAVLQVVAEPAAGFPFQPSNSTAAVAALALVAAGFLLVVRLRPGVPAARPAVRRIAPISRASFALPSMSPVARRRQPEYQS